MPNPAPQQNAPNGNNGAVQIQGKKPSKQTPESNAKSVPQKNAQKQIEHFNADPPKKIAPGRQMPAARREQMVREIDIYVQMVYETLIREAQSNGGNPAGKSPSNHPPITQQVD
jgi:negative regulator of sigma E activity